MSGKRRVQSVTFQTSPPSNLSKCNVPMYLPSPTDPKPIRPSETLIVSHEGNEGHLCFLRLPKVFLSEICLIGKVVVNSSGTETYTVRDIIRDPLCRSVMSRQ